MINLVGVLGKRRIRRQGSVAARYRLFSGSTLKDVSPKQLMGHDTAISSKVKEETNERELRPPIVRFDPFPVRYAEGSVEQQQSAQAFAKLGLSSALILYMSQRYKEPTTVQRAAIPVLLKGDSALLSSQTGSGKTLAFMLPLIIRMQASEQKRKESGLKQQGPRVVVFAPTRELNTQLITQAKSLSHYAKFRARIWGNEKQKLGKDVVPDLVVTTPTAFQREMKWNPRRIESLVLDESDVILDNDAGFSQEIDEIVDQLRVETQIICVGATALKSDASRWIQRRRPDSVVIKTKGVGDLPPSIKLHMVKVADEEGYNKHPALERALAPFLSYPDRGKDVSSFPRCIVFCNSVNSCRSTAHILSEQFSDVADTFCLHGEMRPLQREASWADFTKDPASGGDTRAGKVKLLVCTDLSSRGIDVKNVQHVIIFDLPAHLPDFLHRAGRTGRAGNDGEVTVIVGRGEKSKVLELFEKGKIIRPEKS